MMLVGHKRTADLIAITPDIDHAVANVRAGNMVTDTGRDQDRENENENEHETEIETAIDTDVRLANIMTTGIDAVALEMKRTEDGVKVPRQRNADTEIVVAVPIAMILPAPSDLPIPRGEWRGWRRNQQDCVH